MRHIFLKVTPDYMGRIVLGRQYETDSRELVLDCEELFKSFGPGTPELMYRRECDEIPYLLHCTNVSGNIWATVLKDADTDCPGTGEMEISWKLESGGIGKTAKCLAIVYASAYIGDKPDAPDSWYQRMIDYVDAVNGDHERAAVKASENAEAAAANAKASENAAKRSELNAAESEENAHTSAENANNSAENAAESARIASESEASATEAKTAAEDAKEIAETARDEASESASEAKRSEAAAEASKVAAENSAQSASNSSSNATSKAAEASQSATRAENAKDTAVNAAGTATTKAGEASSSANSAQTSAQEAQRALSDTTNVKNSALQEITVAKNNATNAISEKTEEQLQRIPEVTKLAEDVNSQKENIANLESRKVSVSESKNNDTFYDGVVGRIYNSGYNIISDENSNYKKTYIDITSVSDGFLSYKETGDGRLFFTNNASFGANSFITSVTPETALTANFFLRTGAKREDGWIKDIDIAKLKQWATACVGLAYTNLKDDFDRPFIHRDGKDDTALSHILEKDYGLIETKDGVVIGLGDSLTQGATTSYGNAWLEEFGRLSGLKILNYGVGGEGVRTIMGRQGSQPFIVQPFTIPAGTGKVEINVVSNNNGETVDIKSSATVHTDTVQRGLNPCSISGIIGEITVENGKTYFTRSTSGAEKAISRPMPIITDASNKKGYPLILWMGQNGEYETDDELIAGCKLAISYYGSHKWLVLCPTSGTKSARSGIEKAMHREFGRHFINLREYLSAYGLSDLGINSTEQDRTDMANGTIPTSLRVDGTHFTTDCYHLIGRLIFDRWTELGF